MKLRPLLRVFKPGVPLSFDRDRRRIQEVDRPPLFSEILYAMCLPVRSEVIGAEVRTAPSA
jgi:hypothetical protein